MTERKEAIVIAGQWSGVSVYDREKNLILHIDQCAKTDIIGLAIDALKADTLVWVRDGVEYQTKAGVPLALMILQAIQ